MHCIASALSAGRRPLQVVVEMVKNKLAEDAVQQNGWLLDGYPRRCGRGRTPPVGLAGEALSVDILAAAGAGHSATCCERRSVACCLPPVQR